jgi:hypothetical protein
MFAIKVQAETGNSLVAKFSTFQLAARDTISLSEESVF